MTKPEELKQYKKTVEMRQNNATYLKCVNVRMLASADKWRSFTWLARMKASSSWLVELYEHDTNVPWR